VLGSKQRRGNGWFKGADGGKTIEEVVEHRVLASKEVAEIEWGETMQEAKTTS